MDEPLIDSLPAEEHQAAADLMASVDFRKLGGGDAPADRGPAAPRDEVDRSTLLSTVHVGSSTPGSPVAGTPLPDEFTEAEYARTASVHRTERDAEQNDGGGRDSLTYATPGEELAEDSRRTRGQREQESEQRDADRTNLPGDREGEEGNEIDGADGGVVRRTRNSGDDGEAVAATDGTSGAVAGTTVAAGDTPAPLLAQLGPDQLGPGQFGPGQFGPGQFNPDRFDSGRSGPDKFGQRSFERERADEDPEELLGPVFDDKPEIPALNFADAPLLKMDPASGVEDTAIDLDIRASLTDPSEELSITIAGVPPGATLSAGTDNGNGTWSLDQGDLPGLTITPTANSDANVFLRVTVTSASEINSVQTARFLTVEIDPSADAPVVRVVDAAGNEDATIALDIGAALTDTDGSESLSITVSGVPSGATLSAGADNGNGTWTVTQAQLPGLTITPAPNSDADFTLTVTATAGDGSDTAPTVETLDVTVNAVADAPTVTANDAAGNEDAAIALDIGAALTDTDGSESLSITVSGVPSGATLSAGADNGNGTWTVTQPQLSGLTITPARTATPTSPSP